MSIWDKKYDPLICEKLPDMFRDGSSITKVAAVKLGVSRETFYNWKENYPEFKKAVEIGVALAEAAVEDIAMDGIMGRIENFSATPLIFLMKAQFKKTYGEQKEEKTAADSLLEQLVLGKVKLVSND